ncbi:MAG: hypothetical protein ACREMN_08200 [Gemmatimonadales bacterium]
MLRSALVGLVLSAGATAVASAQRLEERTGLWAGIGLGFGSVRGTCSVCAGRAAGPTALVRFGGTLSRHLRVGVQGTGWLRPQAARERSLLMLSAVGTFYPWPAGGLYLAGGIGGYRYVEEDTESRLSTQGLALQVGAGFDVRITRAVSVAPFATLVVSGSGNPTRLDKSNGFELPLLSDMTVQYVQLGIAATLH